MAHEGLGNSAVPDRLNRKEHHLVSLVYLVALGEFPGTAAHLRNQEGFFVRVDARSSQYQERSDMYNCSGGGSSIVKTQDGITLKPTHTSRVRRRMRVGVISFNLPFWKSHWVDLFKLDL